MVNPLRSGPARNKPSPALVAAVLVLAAAVAGTAIAGPDALTRAVSTSKVKKIAKKQAIKQIKQKAIQGPGRVVTVAVRPGSVSTSTVLAVPELMQVRLACGDSSQAFFILNISGEQMHIGGSWISGTSSLFDQAVVNNNQSWGPVAANLGGGQLTAQATFPSGKAVGLSMTVDEITGNECPVSAQAVVTG